GVHANEWRAAYGSHREKHEAIHHASARCRHLPQSWFRSRRLDSLEPRPHSLAAPQRMVFGSRKGLLGFVWRRQRRLERNRHGCGKRGRRRILSYRAGRQPLLRIRNRRALSASLSRGTSQLVQLSEFAFSVFQVLRSAFATFAGGPAPLFSPFE